MSHLQLYDFVSFSALLSAGGWALCSVMTIHGLHIATQRKWNSIVYAVLCSVVFVATLILGAMQHRDARVSDAQTQQIISGIGQLKSLVQAGPNDTNEQVLAEVIQRIQENAAPRTISLQNQLALADYFRSFGPQTVTVSAIEGNEPFDLAMQLCKIFTSAGWNVTGPDTVVQYGPAPFGLGFGWKSGPKPPEIVQVVANVLKKVGILPDPHGSLDASLATGSFSILVGEKPTN